MAKGRVTGSVKGVNTAGKEIPKGKRKGENTSADRYKRKNASARPVGVPVRTTRVKKTGRINRQTSIEEPRKSNVSRLRDVLAFKKAGGDERVTKPTDEFESVLGPVSEKTSYEIAGIIGVLKRFQENAYRPGRPKKLTEEDEVLISAFKKLPEKEQGTTMSKLIKAHTSAMKL